MVHLGLDQHDDFAFGNAGEKKIDVCVTSVIGSDDTSNFSLGIYNSIFNWIFSQKIIVKVMRR